MAQTLAKGLSVVYGVDGNDKTKTDQFTSFAREHYALATGTMLASGALGVYVAREYAEFEWPVAAGIGLASAAVGLLGASLAYMDRPLFLKYHPWIAGISFVAVAGPMTFFLTAETAGLLNFPTALMLGSVAGLAFVAMESALYNYIMDLIPSFDGFITGVANSKPIKELDKIGEAIGNAVNTTVQDLGLQDKPDLDLDAILKSGTDEQKAVAKEMRQLLLRIVVMGDRDPDVLKRYAAVQAQLMWLVYGSDVVHPDPDADATFIDNNGNPEPPARQSGHYQPPKPAYEGEPFRGELSEADLDGIANNGPPGIRALARSTKAALLRAQASNAQRDIDAYNKLVAQLRMELARNNADLEDQMDD